MKVSNLLMALISLLPVAMTASAADPENERAGVRIRVVHYAIQDGYELVDVYLDSTGLPNGVAGFNLLIAYDTSALSFSEALPGSGLNACGWEYFIYQQGDGADCAGSPCPNGMIRVRAKADVGNIDGGPSCFLSEDGQRRSLVRLRFLSSDDRILECQFTPIRWYWYDCNDNTFETVLGDTVFLSQHVFEPDKQFTHRSIEDLGAPLPGPYGASSECAQETASKTSTRIRALDFYSGGISFVCADSIDSRSVFSIGPPSPPGAYPGTADVIRLSNYFVKDEHAPKTLAEFVYMIRVINGDALPTPKVAPDTVSATFRYNSKGVLEIMDSTEMGAARIVLSGDVTPELLDSQMSMKYQYSAELNETRVLVFSFEGHAFTGPFLKVEGRINSVAFATDEGNPVVATQVK